jgi:hypothetical protein
MVCSKFPPGFRRAFLFRLHPNNDLFQAEIAAGDNATLSLCAAALSRRANRQKSYAKMISTFTGS